LGLYEAVVVAGAPLDDGPLACRLGAGLSPDPQPPIRAAVTARANAERRTIDDLLTLWRRDTEAPVNGR
jgi:hypothetical protein